MSDIVAFAFLLMALTHPNAAALVMLYLLWRLYRNKSQ